MDVKVIPASMDEYRALINADFPDLTINSIKYLGSGWENAAILVNEDTVFRFPRALFENPESLNTKNIGKEVKVLKFLAGKLSFATPNPDYVAPSHRYFGYKLLKGTLWDQVGQDEQLTDEYLRDWVLKRSELSKAVSEEDAKNLGLDRYHTNKNEQLVKQFLAEPESDERVKTLAQNAMQMVLTKLKTTEHWVFVHEDLQMSNCFVDPTEKKITGVIDFGKAEMAPVEAEFYFWSKYGRETLERVAKIQQEYDGTSVDIDFAIAIHQFYVVADYQDFKTRGFSESANRKWNQIKSYL